MPSLIFWKGYDLFFEIWAAPMEAYTMVKK